MLTSSRRDWRDFIQRALPWERAGSCWSGCTSWRGNERTFHSRQLWPRGRWPGGCADYEARDTEFIWYTSGCGVPTWRLLVLPTESVAADTIFQRRQSGSAIGAVPTTSFICIVL